MFERNLISDAMYDRLIGASSLQDAVRILQETRYQPHIAQMDHYDHFESMLTQELSRQADEIKALVDDRELIDLLFLKYDYHNLKIMVKNELGGEQYDHLFYAFGSQFVPEVKQWINEPMKNAKSTRFQQSVEAARAVYAQTHDAQALDLVVDHAYFVHMAELAKALKRPYFIDYAANVADFTNMLSFLRVRHQNQPKDVFAQTYAEGGKIDSDILMSNYRSDDDVIRRALKSSAASKELYGAFDAFVTDRNIAAFEKAKDQYVYQLAVDGSKQMDGPEVLFSYMLRVETEVQNLRIILTGKRSEIAPERIRERIRAHV